MFLRRRRRRRRRRFTAICSLLLDSD